MRGFKPFWCGLFSFCSCAAGHQQPFCEKYSQRGSMKDELSFSELRQRGGWTVEEIAEQLGYSASTVYRWERGEQEPKAAVSQALKSLVRFSPKEETKDHFTFVDLFAGIGGLRIGFEIIGGHCAFTSEWDS